MFSVRSNPFHDGHLHVGRRPRDVDHGLPAVVLVGEADPDHLWKNSLQVNASMMSTKVTNPGIWAKFLI